MYQKRNVIRTTTLHIKQYLLDAGFQIYRITDTEIYLAERVRMHLMDSGICISNNKEPLISFRMRAQRSDFPHIPPETLFKSIRQLSEESIVSHGFHESKFNTCKVNDPIDKDKVLDIWHEIIYSKRIENIAELIEDIRWLLSLERYLTP